MPFLMGKRNPLHKSALDSGFPTVKELRTNFLTGYVFVKTALFSVMQPLFLPQVPSTGTGALAFSLQTVSL